MQNNTNSSSKAKEFIKKHKKPLIIAGGVYLLLMFGVMAWAISFAFSDNSDSSYVTPTNDPSQTEAPVEPAENTAPQEQASESKSRHAVSEDAAEHYCQDAGLLNKYVDSSKISTIYASSYGKKYTDSFSYDKSGNPVWFLQWNGKNKSAGEAARFSCWISGNSDDDITLHWLSLDGVDLYGQAGFEQYDESGKLRD